MKSKPMNKMTELFSIPVGNRLMICCCVLLILSTRAYGQLDRVYPNGQPPVGGEVTLMSAKGVQVKKGSGTQTFVASDISKIMYEGDPAALTKGRQFAMDGQYAQAMQELTGIDVESLPRDVIKADVAYYVAYCKAKQALSGNGDKKAAASAIYGFTKQYSDSWHFYDAIELVGDLAKATGNIDAALNFYGMLAKAPSTTRKLKSVYLTGIAKLEKGDAEAAMADFEKVIGFKADSVRDARLQSLCKAGKAAAFAKANKADEGLKLVSELVAELDQADFEMNARIYNAQGANFEAKGDNEGAIMAYLRTHLLFSSQRDAHAIAMSKLVELFPKVGKPERGAEFRGELKQLYPGFGN